MKEVPRPAFNFPGLWFQIGNVQILTQESPEAGKAGWPIVAIGWCRAVTSGVRRLGCGRGLEIGRDAWRRIASPLQQRPDGVEQVFFYDLDDHLVELFLRGCARWDGRVVTRRWINL